MKTIISDAPSAASAAWLHASLSYQGTSHAHSGLPNQDACHAFTAGDTISGAVCDGAGSQPYSHLGSGFLSRLACKWMAANLKKIHGLDDIAIRRDFYSYARPRFKTYAKLCGRKQAEMPATLLAVGVLNDGRWLAMHLGDGVILARTTTQTIPISLPDNGEFANTTWFFTSPEAPQRTRVYKGNEFLQGERVGGFILASDGIEKAMVTLHTGKPGEIAGKLLARLAADGKAQVENDLQQGMAIFKNLSHDDGTLLLLANREVLPPIQATPPQAAVTAPQSMAETLSTDDGGKTENVAPPHPCKRHCRCTKKTAPDATSPVQPRRHPWVTVAATAVASFLAGVAVAVLGQQITSVPQSNATLSRNASKQPAVVKHELPKELKPSPPAINPSAASATPQTGEPETDIAKPAESNPMPAPEISPPAGKADAPPLSIDETNAIKGEPK